MHRLWTPTYKNHNFETMHAIPVIIHSQSNSLECLLFVLPLFVEFSLIRKSVRYFIFLLKFVMQSTTLIVIVILGIESHTSASLFFASLLLEWFNSHFYQPLFLNHTYSFGIQIVLFR